MAQSVPAVPAGFRTVTPHLVCSGAADALAFYQQAFGATEIRRTAGPDGKIVHAEIDIGDSRVMLSDDFPEYGARAPRDAEGAGMAIHLYVDDADALWRQALAAGAEPVMPLADVFWGDRYGEVIDPFGHKWAIATHQRDVTPEQIQAGMQQAMAPQPGARQ